MTISNPPHLEENLDALHPPAWDLMPPTAYPEAPQGIFFRRLPIACTVLTRGCPGACTFCAGHTIQGRRIRSRSVDGIIDELKFLQAEYGVREMHFLDDNLTIRREFAARLCEAIAKYIDITWCCPNGLRLDTLDTELLRLMKRSGCYSVSIGIESGVQSILDATRKGFRLENVEEKVRLIRSEGLEVCGFFILGFPMDTPETILGTIRFACRLPLDRATFSTFLPLPGAALTQQLIDSGEIREIDYKRLFQADVPYSPPGIAPRRLKQLQRLAFFRFFLRPRILRGVMRNIRTMRQIRFLIERAVIFLG